MKRIAATASIAAVAALALALPAIASTPNSAVVAWGFPPIKYGTPSTSTVTPSTVTTSGISLAMAGTPKKSTVRLKWSGFSHNVVILSGDQRSKSQTQIVQIKPVTTSAGVNTAGLPNRTGSTNGNFSYDFKTAGTYTVYCAVGSHYTAGMKMLVKVG